MDPTVLVLPGAQALVSQILTDGWAQARSWLSRRLGRADVVPAAELEQRLDAAQAQVAAFSAPEAISQRALLEAYWAGYLAALAAEHPEYAAAVATLAAPPADGGAERGNVNSVTGTVTGNLVQARDIHGGVTFN